MYLKDKLHGQNQFGQNGGKSKGPRRKLCFDFNKGIYVNREYSKETECNRCLLRPILQAAKKLPENKDLCRMEADVLNLNGTKFSKDNLHELPSKLNIMEITTKSNAEVIGLLVKSARLAISILASFSTMESNSTHLSNLSNMQKLSSLVTIIAKQPC